MAKAKVFEPFTTGDRLRALHPDFVPFFKEIHNYWDAWIGYKFLQHKQRFATIMSECAAIKKLHYMAEGEPFLASKLIEYAMGELWEGFYMPKEPGLWAHWKKEMSGAVEAPKIVQPPIDDDLAFLVKNEGWPEAAFKSPSWFNEESAEAWGDYKRYLIETRTFFGDLTPENSLTESEWRQYMGNKGRIGKFDNEVGSSAELAARRLQFHIDFHKSGYTNIRTFLGIQ